MVKKLISLCLCLSMLSVCVPAAAAAPPPAITWCAVSVFSDRAELSFYTPEALLSAVDAYEFRQGETAWITAADSRGGKLILHTGGTVSLRCVKDGTAGAIFSYFVEFGDSTLCADTRSGISAVFRASSGFRPDTVITANRIRSGAYYDAASNAVAQGQEFVLYDIYFSDSQGNCFDPGDRALIRVPFGGALRYGCCSVYRMDETNKRILPIDCQYDRAHTVFRTQGNGLYFVIGTWSESVPMPQAPRHEIGSFFDFYGKEILCGDVSGNGFVEASDARLILRASVRLEELTAEQEEAADVNADGTVTAADARSVLRKCVGLSE